MFLPTTKQELEVLGWPALDIILVTGDSYLDSPFIGAAVIGKVLSAAGYRVGIIAQPDVDTEGDITRLGEPGLFWGVSGGSVDSMVANYTALKKRRKSDDYTPGGLNNRRPDRAVIAYANLIKKYFKNTRPLVLGGIEASLRRIAHYDFWSNTIRRSILFDAKADILVYGMAEKTVLQLAEALKNNGDYRDIPGLCYQAGEAKPGFLRLPDYQEVQQDPNRFIEMFHAFYRNNDPLSANGLSQRQNNRFLIQNPPAPCLDQEELDRVYELDYSHDQHPYYERQGRVRALDTIRFAITSHRGCYGECNFCAIAVHQGRTVRCRSEASMLREAQRLAAHPAFKGNILDVGGPTANMYGYECPKKLKKGSCPEKRCLTPNICPSLAISHQRQLALLKKLKNLPGIKKVFVASGIRPDLIMADRKHGRAYLAALVQEHISGQMKIAPEHSEEQVLEKMGKPGVATLLAFKDLFYAYTREAGKKQFLTYYFIAAHPGCGEEEMTRLKAFCHKELQTIPEQIQIFTPTPSTYSSLMYCTGKDPWSLAPLFVEKNNDKKERQKQIILAGKKKPGRHRKKQG